MKKTATSLFPFDAALEQSRGAAGELGNHAIDEFKAGRLSRRELLRHASLIGMPRAHAQAPAGKPGGTIRVAHLTPAGAVDPLTVTDAAGLALINQTGEFLIDDDGQELKLRPSLALSWKSNAKGDVWTFKLRPNVKFHDGQSMTAKDVAATFNRLALSPYVPAVRAHHVGSVMPSYSDVDWTEDGLGNRINMHGNRDLITVDDMAVFENTWIT